MHPHDFVWLFRRLLLATAISLPHSQIHLYFTLRHLSRSCVASITNSRPNFRPVKFFILPPKAYPYYIRFRRQLICIFLFYFLPPAGGNSILGPKQMLLKTYSLSFNPPHEPPY